MSQLGMRWEIDGVGAAYIARGSVNGSYIITFARAMASLEDIERHTHGKRMEFLLVYNMNVTPSLVRNKQK